MPGKSIQMVEDLSDHPRVFDAGDDPDGASACPAGLDVDPEYALQTLDLRLMAARRFDAVSTLSPRQRRALPPGATLERRLLLGANTPWKRVRFTRGFGTGAARRAMKSSGPMALIRVTQRKEKDANPPARPGNPAASDLPLAGGVGNGRCFSGPDFRDSRSVHRTHPPSPKSSDLCLDSDQDAPTSRAVNYPKMDSKRRRL